MPDEYQEKTWKEFQESGLLWFVNRLLHVFGWVLVYERDSDTKEITRLFPARTTRLGFPEHEDRASQRQFLTHFSGFQTLPVELICICPKECDCENFEGGLVSNECPEHNDFPNFTEGCPVHDSDDA